MDNVRSEARIGCKEFRTRRGPPLEPKNTAALQLNGVLDSLQSNLNNLKSKYNYTV